MSRIGCSADKEFNKLRVLSQSENRKLTAVAGQIVDEAVRRARGRPADS